MKQMPCGLRHGPNWFRFTSIQNVIEEKANSIQTQLDMNAISQHLLECCFNLIHFPASFIRLWPSFTFDLEGGWIETWLGVVPRTNKYWYLIISCKYRGSSLRLKFYYYFPSKTALAAICILLCCPNRFQHAKERGEGWFFYSSLQWTKPCCWWCCCCWNNQRH